MSDNSHFNLCWLPAGGDLTGSYPNPTVAGIRGVKVNKQKPTIGQVLVYDGSRWTPTTPTGGSSNATQLQGRNISVTAPTNGQVLTWNNTTSMWTPTTPTGGSSNATQLQGTNINSSLSPQNNYVLTWDSTNSNWVASAAQGGPPTGAASGDLTGTYPAPTVSKLQGKTLTIGSTPLTGDLLTWTGTAWVNQAGNPASGTALTWNGTNWSGTLPTGDLNGSTYSSLRVNSLQNVPLTATGAIAGQVLTFKSSIWQPSNITQLQGRTISVTAPTDGQVLTWNNTTSMWTPVTPSGGSGNATQLQGTAIISSLTPTNGQVLTWNGTAWVAMTPSGGSGNATQLQTYPVSATAPGLNQVLTWNGTSWQAANTQSGTPAGAAGGDLGGTYPNPQVAGINNYSITPATPATGQILVWSNNHWVYTSPAGDLGNNYTAPQVTGIKNVPISTLVDKQILVYDATNNRWSSTSPSGTLATPDLVGDYLNGPTINAIQGYPVVLTTPSAGQVLLYNLSGNWVNSGLSGDMDVLSTGLTKVLGLQGNAISSVAPTTTGQVLGWDSINNVWFPSNVVQLQGFLVSSNPPNVNDVLTYSLSNGWHPSPTQASTPIGSAGGDLAGTYPNPKVNRLMNGIITQLTAPNNGDVMYYNSGWVSGPATGGDVTGTFPVLDIQELQGNTVTAATPTNGQALTYNGSAWIPQSVPTIVATDYGVILAGSYHNKIDFVTVNNPGTTVGSHAMYRITVTVIFTTNASSFEIKDITITWYDSVMGSSVQSSSSTYNVSINGAVNGPINTINDGTNSYTWTAVATPTNGNSFGNNKIAYNATTPSSPCVVYAFAELITPQIN